MRVHQKLIAVVLALLLALSSVGAALAYEWPEDGDADWGETLRTGLRAMEEAIAAAGTGTASVRIGTRTERLSFATPYDGLLWSEKDYPAVWHYEETGTVWKWVGAEIINDDTFASATNSNIPTAASTKAYVDNQVAAVTVLKEIRISLMGTVGTGSKLVQVLSGVSGTITAIKGIIDSGTSATITLKNGSNTVYAGLVVTTSGVTQGSGFSYAVVSTFSKLQLDVTGVSGSPANLLLYISINPS